MLERMFFDHPGSVGETYGQHLRSAGSFGAAMILAGVACLIHAVVPGLFIDFGSKVIARLHDKMIVNRRRVADGVSTGAMPRGAASPAEPAMHDPLGPQHVDPSETTAVNGGGGD